MTTSTHIKPKDLGKFNGKLINKFFCAIEKPPEEDDEKELIKPTNNCQQVIDGQTYKIGSSGKVFALRDNDWVLSFNYTPEELGELLHAKKHRYRNHYD